jgi:sialate O-acetylesterase
MINEWRTDWKMPALPFGIVQLPSAKWDAARSAQYRVSRNVPNTFLVVTSDLPSPSQLHPTTKRPIGRRMGIGLRGTVYGQAIEYSGPLAWPAPTSYASGNKIVVSFAHVGSGLITSGGSPAPAQIATATGRFVSATATIVGNTIEFTGNLTNPKRVRFGYGGQGNLFNIVNIPVEGGAATETRLPASLFELTVP